MTTNMFKTCVFAVTTVLLFSCTKETVIEKNIVPERQASPQIKDSISNVSVSQLTLQKSSLGKAFILIPTMTSSGKQPDVNYLKPLIISFEKSGGKIALFNLTEAQLYNTIPSSRLLQTFDIVSEDELSVKLNLADGFTSFDAQNNLGVILKSIMEEMKQRIQTGNESSFEVKESFVRNTESAGESVYIEQVMRLKADLLSEKKNPYDSTAKPKLTLESIENTSTFIFEIKPYFSSSTFKAKIYDKDQRAGYFLNFAVKEQLDEPVPQVAKWDIDASKGPIVVKLHNKTPEAVVKSMSEGVLYWNLAFGKEVLKIGSSFASDEKQADRTIHIYWIPWDTAGYARAGLQADPITGEIFRGQVFMTSSWYVGVKDKLKLKLGDRNLNLKSDLFTCTLEQSKLLNLDTSKLTSSAAERVTQDTIRDVLAHEMGHVLGLRHNFAGSFTTNTSDLDFLNVKKNYLKGDITGLAASSTTVMDYTKGIETGIDGAYIKNNVLPYDKAAIEWGYFDLDTNVVKYKYCSDEHIILADAAKKSVYGCDRFDGFNNIIAGNLENEKENIENAALKVFQNILSAIKTSKSNYSNTITFEDLITQIHFSPSFYSLDSMIYKDPNVNFVSIEKVIDGLLPDLSGQGLPATDSLVAEKFKNDALVIGGLSGLLERLLKLQSDSANKVYEQQATQLFQKLNYDDYKDLFTAEQFEKIKTTMLDKAKEADKAFLVNILQSFPIIKSVFAMDPVTKEYKSTDSSVNVAFGLGNADTLIARYLAVYETSIHQTKVDATVAGIQKTYYFSPASNYGLEFIEKLFKPSVITSPVGLPHAELLKSGLEKMKQSSVANTIEILQTLGLVVTMPVTSVQLMALLEQVDWTRVTGVTKSMLQDEVYALKAWETLK